MSAAAIDEERHPYKKGDRVKVTIEGVVSEEYSTRKTLYVNGTSGDDLDYIGFLPNIESPDVTIERLLDPLPTTPGSVLRYRHGTSGWTYRTLYVDGRWHAYFNGDGAEPREFGTFYKDYEVIYDAGKTS